VIRVLNCSCNITAASIIITISGGGSGIASRPRTAATWSIE